MNGVNIFFRFITALPTIKKVIPKILNHYITNINLYKFSYANHLLEANLKISSKFPICNYVDKLIL